MKKLSQAVALVAVTTLFATAFSVNMERNHIGGDANVAQVVIVGKRMTALEKAQYDRDKLSATQTTTVAQ